MPRLVAALCVVLAFSSALQARAELPVAALTGTLLVPNEIPSLLPTDSISLAPGYPQVIRLRISNNGPSDAPNVDVQSIFSAALRTEWVRIDVDPICGIELGVQPSLSLRWPIADLRAGDQRECDLTFSATGAGPPPPEGANTMGILFVAPTSDSVRPPPGMGFVSSRLNFFVSSRVATLANYAAQVDPTPLRINPGEVRDISVFLTNRGPQALVLPDTRFYGRFERYTHAFPDFNEGIDPFRIFPLPSPGCQHSLGLDITTGLGWSREHNVLLDSLAPGETRECRYRVEALRNATGERTLLFTQRLQFPGVIDPDLSNNIAPLRMMFSDPPPLPVPTGSRAMLAVLALLLGLIGTAALAARER